MKSIFTAYEYPIEKYRENLCSDLYNVGHPENFFTYPYYDLVKETVLSYGDCSFIKGIADYITRGNLLSTSQCKRLLKIVAKAEDKGYIMPNE